MPYKSNDELPQGVKKLPAEAQSAWRKIYNNAFATYDGNEQKSNATAWSGLKDAGWEKDSSGEWKKVEKSAFLKADASQRYTLGIVYSPMEIDSQDEFSDSAEIEKACWEFTKAIQGNSKLNKMAMALLDSIIKAVKDGEPARLDITDIWGDIEKGSGLGYMHESWDEGIGDIVENYIAPVGFSIGNEKVTKGTWLMGIIWSPDYFPKVQKGEITGLSMGGRGRKVSVKEVK